MLEVLPRGKVLSILKGNINGGAADYAAPVEELDDIRTGNFLRILREKYEDSPIVFETQTGYSQTMVSQIKTGAKKVGDKRARKLEKLMKLKRLTLDLDQVSAGPNVALPAQWPFSAPFEAFTSLSPRVQAEIDEAVTRMILGAQAQAMMNKPKKFGPK